MPALLPALTLMFTLYGTAANAMDLPKDLAKQAEVMGTGCLIGGITGYMVGTGPMIVPFVGKIVTPYTSRKSAAIGCYWGASVASAIQGVSTALDEIRHGHF